MKLFVEFILIKRQMEVLYANFNKAKNKKMLELPKVF